MKKLVIGDCGSNRNGSVVVIVMLVKLKVVIIVEEY